MGVRRMHGAERQGVSLLSGGSRFRVQASGFRVQGSGFRVQGRRRAMHDSSRIASDRCEANLAHISQSGPESGPGSSGPGFKVKHLEPLKLLPFRSAAILYLRLRRFDCPTILEWMSQVCGTNTTTLDQNVNFGRGGTPFTVLESFVANAFAFETCRDWTVSNLVTCHARVLEGVAKGQFPPRRWFSKASNHTLVRFF